MAERRRPRRASLPCAVRGLSPERQGEQDQARLLAGGGGHGYDGAGNGEPPVREEGLMGWHPLVTLGGCFLLSAPPGWAAAATPQQQRAAAAIEKAGGKVIVEEGPGGPVVKVFLTGGKVMDDALAPLEHLKGLP